MLSHDGGKTWSWLCEDAIGYKGMYDPHYSYTQTGALFASTFAGLKVARNGCTFDATAAGASFVSDNTLGPDHAVYYAASDPGDASAGTPANFEIFHSATDGATFTMSAPTTTVNWWQTLRVAPSNPMRVYLTGYKFVPDANGGNKKQQLMFRSNNAGQTWTELTDAQGQLKTATGTVKIAANSVLDVEGIESDNPDALYLRVEVDDNTISDSIYRSADQGATWTKILTQPASILGFVVRAAKTGANHDLVAATQALGSQVSHDNGATWTALAGAPHINCLVENTAGELWACTQNYGFNGAPSDDAGVMKTTDLATWTKVLRYQALTDAATCAAGTAQHDLCVPQWCAVCAQLGCTPPASYNCPVQGESPVVPPSSKGGGCCDAGSSGAGALALGLVIGTVLLRPRRRAAS